MRARGIRKMRVHFKKVQQREKMMMTAIDNDENDDNETKNTYSVNKNLQQRDF